MAWQCIRNARGRTPSELSEEVGEEMVVSRQVGKAMVLLVIVFILALVPVDCVNKASN